MKDSRNKQSRRYVLAIETAVSGGSLSILQNNSVVGSWTGKNQISKVEELLPQIERLLDQNHIKKSEIKNVVVSRGPGSHTGVRIGIATGLGLKKAWQCELYGVAVFDALSLLNTISRPSLAAVPVGRNQIAWGKYESAATRKRQTIPFIHGKVEQGGILDFLEVLKKHIGIKLFLHSDLIEVVNGVGNNPPQHLETFTDIAVLLGLYSMWGSHNLHDHKIASDNVKVIYLNK